MSVSITIDGQNLCARLEGELDHHSAAFLRERIDYAVETARPGLLTLDFSGVSFMDSSGVGLVMGRYKNAAAYGGEVELLNLSRQAERIMRMAGLERLVKIRRSGEKS